MASGKTGRERNAHEARERARLYQARREFHEGQERRRTRDNVLVGIIGGAIVIGAIASQFVYYGAGPGAPTPSPEQSVTPTPTIPATPDPSTPATPSPTEAPIGEDDQPEG